MKILVAIILSLMFTISLVKIVLLVWDDWKNNDRNEVEKWLEKNNLGEYRHLFKGNEI